MSPNHEHRTKRIIEQAETLLPHRNFGGAHNFMLSTDEAFIVGSAVASRNHKVLCDILSEPIEQMEEHYDSFSIQELKDEWTDEIQRTTGMEGTLKDFLVEPTHQDALDDVLCGRFGENLDLKPIVMTKLLETILYATAAEGTETFKPRLQGPARRISRRMRLNSRANLLLNTEANRELGVRNIREGLLEGDEEALDTYLESMARVRLAQKVVGDTINRYQEGQADTLREGVFAQLEERDGFDELLQSHILTWEMLPKEITDSPNRTKLIKEIIEDNARTNKQRASVRDNWHDERIDTLFEIAHLSTTQGRSADIYISSTFDGGAGLYIAAVLSHPLEGGKSITIADNPLNGNALYTVDEQLTESDDDGRQYGWKEVLGTYKRVARSRGARRRYHTGDWSQLAKAVCEYGGDHKLAEQKRREAAKKADGPYLVDPSLDVYEALQQALARARSVKY